MVKNKERMDTYTMLIMMVRMELLPEDKAHKSITAHNIPKMDDRISLARFAYVAKIIKNMQTIAVGLIDNSSIFQMNFLFYPFFFYFNKKLQFNLFIKQVSHIFNCFIFQFSYHASRLSQHNTFL